MAVLPARAWPSHKSSSLGEDCLWIRCTAPACQQQRHFRHAQTRHMQVHYQWPGGIKWGNGGAMCPQDPKIGIRRFGLGPATMIMGPGRSPQAPTNSGASRPVLSRGVLNV